jgi:hypothetical protein
MPTVALTIQIADVSQLLASADVAKGSLFSNKVDPRLPIMLYVENEPLKKIYNADSTYEGLQQIADYVYALCGKYASKASAIVSGGSGGSVAPVTPTQTYPIYITNSNFTTATFYPNTNIFGNTVIIFLNEINRYLIPGDEFTVDSTGVTITLSGFDASVNTYNLIIEKYS